ncbi:MAG: hypothetical protein PHW66_04240 [Gallionella sp.]|nr:hypothetical protein [Gallionella sp.]
MRIKSHWFREGRSHGPQEVSDALAFVLWKISDNALKNTRNADFSIEVGEQYLDFLGEVLFFLILVADRLAYRRLSAEDRALFTGNLANRVAATYAENRGRLLARDEAGCKQAFIDRLNRRAGEYADFDYTDAGPDYGFYRYLAYCIGEILNDADSFWITDQIVTLEAPEMVRMIEKTVRDLFESEPREPRRRRGSSGE